MSWSYADPAASQKDAVRFLVGDTDTADQQMQDEEVLWLLSQNGNDTYQAAIAACGTLSAKYTRRSNKSVGTLSISYASISKSYVDLRSTLMTQALRHNTPRPYAGGISQSDAETDDNNTDLNRPNFTVGMGDNPGTASDINGGGFTQVVPG